MYDMTYISLVIPPGKGTYNVRNLIIHCAFMLLGMNIDKKKILIKSSFLTDIAEKCYANGKSHKFKCIHRLCFAAYFKLIEGLAHNHPMLLKL